VQYPLAFNSVNTGNTGTGKECAKQQEQVIQLNRSLYKGNGNCVSTPVMVNANYSGIAGNQYKLEKDICTKGKDAANLMTIKSQSQSNMDHMEVKEKDMFCTPSRNRDTCDESQPIDTTLQQRIDSMLVESKLTNTDTSPVVIEQTKMDASNNNDNIKSGKSDKVNIPSPKLSPIRREK